MERHDSLTKLNNALLRQIFEWLKIDIEILTSNDFIRPDEASEDHRWLGKKSEETLQMPKYSQVFDAKNPFQPNMSIVDLIFNMGPEATDYLSKIYN